MGGQWVCRAPCCPLREEMQAQALTGRVASAPTSAPRPVAPPPSFWLKRSQTAQPRPHAVLAASQQPSPLALAAPRCSSAPRARLRPVPAATSVFALVRPVWIPGLTYSCFEGISDSHKVHRTGQFLRGTRAVPWLSRTPSCLWGPSKSSPAWGGSSESCKLVVRFRFLVFTLLGEHFVSGMVGPQTHRLLPSQEEATPWPLSSLGVGPAAGPPWAVTGPQRGCGC